MDRSVLPDRPGTRVRATLRKKFFPWIWLLAGGAVVLLGNEVWERHADRPLVRLRTAAGGEVRFLQPRISGGFAWAPLADVERTADPFDLRRMELAGVAADVLKATAKDDTADGRDLSVRAHLLGGDAEAAMKKLLRTPESSRSASTWNDLAAAHYSLAGSSRSLEHLEDALAAVDEALRQDPGYAEALFNRALILEGFHLRDAAVEAWREYLRLHSGETWAVEARDHLELLTRPEPSFATEIERQYSRLERGEADAAVILSRLDAGEARAFFQSEGFARWAQAFTRGDTEAAARHLTALRTFASSLKEFNGDELLADSVAAIERADGTQRAMLARGHTGLVRGRRVYKEERRPGAAEVILRDAARELASGGSPMADEARVQLAVAVFGQNRVEEAEAILGELNSSVASRYRALRAYVLWQQASCLTARAEWGASIRLFTAAIDGYVSLRERGNSAYLRDIVSQIYDAVGDRTLAGQNRLLALEELGKSASYRLQHAVGGMVYDATSRKDWRAAMSYLTLEVDLARRVRDSELQTNVLLNRALLSARLGNHAGAERDLREANRIAGAVRDGALRAKLSVDCTAAAALISRDPRAAVPLLTDALRFHGERGWRMLMPDLYLRRGRMFMALGERERAVADFEAGIVELENHRESLPSGEARWGVLDAADELFAEAVKATVDLDVPTAFAYAERERARSLSDVYRDDPKRFDHTILSESAAIVEYVTLPDELIIFAVDRKGYQVARARVAATELMAVLDQVNQDLHDGVVPRDSKAVLRAYDLLIAPVTGFVALHREVVFVPDSTTSAVPFAALINRATGRTMIEDHVVSVVPAARMYVRSRQRHSGAARRDVLIVDSPVNETAQPLTFARAEAVAIAGSYAESERLSGPAATAAAVVEQAPRHEVVHIAAHNIGRSDSAALILTATSEDTGTLEATAISQLRLTRTAVVILAGCGSARGPMRTAEGQLSVGYAFLQAGVPAVIATLWPISDRESAAFFPRLHRHLATGMAAAEALRLAQLESMRDPLAGNSSVWTAVQVSGY